MCSGDLIRPLYLKLVDPNISPAIEQALFAAPGPCNQVLRRIAGKALRPNPLSDSLGAELPGAGRGLVRGLDMDLGQIKEGDSAVRANEGARRPSRQKEA